MPVADDQDAEDQRGGDQGDLDEFSEILGFGRVMGHSILTIDLEALNVQWSAVRPGVDYGPGNLAADLAADVLRGMHGELEHRSPVDRVQAKTDEEGNPFLHVWLNAAGVIEVAALVRDGRRFRGVVDFRAVSDWLSEAARRVSAGRGDVAAAVAASAACEMSYYVTSTSTLDRVQAIKEFDGTALVYVCMNASGVLELAALVRDGRRLRAGVAGEVR
jgi:hypothetical protein